MFKDLKIRNRYLLHMVYVVALPLAFIASALLFNQFDIRGFYSFGKYNYDFHLLILTCIIFVGTFITRTVLYLLFKSEEMTLRQYELWCLGEMLLCSIFAAIYTYLIKDDGQGYLSVLQTSIKFVGMTLVIPYVILIMARIIRMQGEELEKANTPEDNSLVRFYDEHKRLKLSIAPSSILYVNAEFNYVKINYLDAGRVKEFMLRASMKSLEDMDVRCLVRCQRSYFVNPEHVAVLRKDSQGFIYAEMNIPDVPAVPVSKQYYDALSALL